jgi:hypothetical protein
MGSHRLHVTSISKEQYAPSASATEYIDFSSYEIILATTSLALLGLEETTGSHTALARFTHSGSITH